MKSVLNLPQQSHPQSHHQATEACNPAAQWPTVHNCYWCVHVLSLVWQFFFARGVCVCVWIWRKYDGQFILNIIIS